ncbi:MAG: hypothetical protein A4E64_01815 [Syntrophorhabdus sp. PtaU1.Bin058]|nr:MAG: hypothetical protein A4E64_01815 [Syntrophorhabdus sp. PtaU1.Bin058]
MGAVMGGLTGGLYCAGVPGPVLLTAGAGVATATNGLDGLACYAAGTMGGMAGGYVAGKIRSAYYVKYGSPYEAGPYASAGSAEQNAERLDTRVTSSLNVNNDPIIRSGPNIVSGINAAWNDSNPGMTATREHGGWIVIDTETGDLSIQRWPEGQQAIITPTPRPVYAVAHFHTHPNIGPMWNPNPSPPDIVYTMKMQIPGYVRNINGIVRIDPNDGRCSYVWP